MTVLVGYRPNPEGEAALRLAVAEAGYRDAELLIARHVQLEAGDTDGNRRAEEAQQELDALCQRLSGEGVRCRSEWSVGPAKGSRALLDLAERIRPELLVIGLRRRSPVGKLVLGSESQDIILQAEVPVLAVKAPEDD